MANNSYHPPKQSQMIKIMRQKGKTDCEPVCHPWLLGKKLKVYVLLNNEIIFAYKGHLISEEELDSNSPFDKIHIYPIEPQMV